MININDKNIFEISQRYKEAGYEIYLVGGAVRDLLLGLSPKDYDFTTNAPMEVTKELFKDKKISSVGEEFGTIPVIFEDGNEYEITIYREDLNQDGRKTEIAPADSIEDDLKRRDFTFNAMAYDPLTKKLVDPFNGLEDLKNKRIAFVGNPQDRVKEDHLRAIRYIRFLCRFNLNPKEGDFQKIKEVFDPNALSMERIQDELKKIISYKLHPGYNEEIASAFEYLGVFKPWSEKTKEITFKSLTSGDLTPIITEMYKEEEGDKKLEKAFQKSRLPKEYKQKAKVILFLEEHGGDPEAIKRSIGAINKSDKGTWKKAVNEFFKMNETVQEVPDQLWENYVTTKELDITGNDLKEMGISGKAIGEVLSALEEHILNYPDDNNNQTLKKLIPKLVDLENPKAMIRQKFYKELGGNKREVLNTFINLPRMREVLHKFLGKDLQNFINSFFFNAKSFSHLTPWHIFRGKEFSETDLKTIAPLFMVNYGWRASGEGLKNLKGEDLNLSDENQIKQAIIYLKKSLK